MVNISGVFLCIWAISLHCLELPGLSRVKVFCTCMVGVSGSELVWETVSCWGNQWGVHSWWGHSCYAGSMGACQRGTCHGFSKPFRTVLEWILCIVWGVLFLSRIEQLLVPFYYYSRGKLAWECDQTVPRTISWHLCMFVATLYHSCVFS